MKKHFIGALVALSLSCPVLAEDGTLDQAANGYILLCAVLVLLMSIPAIGLFLRRTGSRQKCLISS